MAWCTLTESVGLTNHKVAWWYKCLQPSTSCYSTLQLYNISLLICYRAIWHYSTSCRYKFECICYNLLWLATIKIRICWCTYKSEESLDDEPCTCICQCPKRLWNNGKGQQYWTMNRYQLSHLVIQILSIICDNTSNNDQMHQPTSFLAAVGCTGLWRHLKPTEERVYWLCRPMQTCAATENTWSSQDWLMWSKSWRSFCSNFRLWTIHTASFILITCCKILDSTIWLRKENHKWRAGWRQLWTIQHCWKPQSWRHCGHGCSWQWAKEGQGWQQQSWRLSWWAGWIDSRRVQAASCKHSVLQTCISQG